MSKDTIIKDVNAPYKGVNISKETAEYFTSATANFGYAKEAALNCTTYALKSAGYGYKVLGHAFMGVCGYKIVAGEVMTGHAFGFAMPKIVSGIVAGAASAIYYHPTAVMAGFVAAAVLASPEDSFELAKNVVNTTVEAGKFVYHNAAGIVDGAVGIANLVYDNLPSYDNTPHIVDLAGSMLLEAA